MSIKSKQSVTKWCTKWSTDDTVTNVELWPLGKSMEINKLNVSRLGTEGTVFTNETVTVKGKYCNFAGIGDDTSHETPTQIMIF